MQQTPKGLRLHLGIFGRTNVGKSSFLNMLAGQQVAITSEIAGTTTDVVEKAMELLPIGPVVFLDTAGLDDKSKLGQKRIEKTLKIFERADVIVIVTEPNIWTEFEEQVAATAKEKKLPLIIIINKSDTGKHTLDLKKHSEQIVAVSSIDENREQYVTAFKHVLMSVCPENFLNAKPLISDLIPAVGTVIFIVPIDLQAPKGRLILPQVQAIRETLDSDATAIVVKEREYRATLANLKNKPDLVVCDSQVVLKMVADTPADIKCTTFSTLFARYKGDLETAVAGARTIDELGPGDKILIAEACTHHALEDDIGRVKIPRWLRQYTGLDLTIDTYTGHDFPKDITAYKLIIHCGSCMLNRRETLWRYEEAKEKKVAITNYGVCISFLQGVLERVIAPFN
jgi:[FeFe] hydrogenase H-cluster maturation GTPase HydF